MCHIICSAASLQCVEASIDQDYYYTRTRNHPHHLRISEDFKNNYVHDVKFESTINGTKWEYYKANQVATFDELVFETIDKIFRHRLSPFYIHHYDSEEDKKRSYDKRRVSHERCARDLLYLIDKLHPTSASNAGSSSAKHDNHLTPELSAFFDSYARPEAGVLMGNTYWVGAYDQCTTRHIFDLLDSTGQRLGAAPAAAAQSSAASEQDKRHKQQVVSFRGRYCVASLKSPQWDRLIEERKEKSRNYFKSERQFSDYAKLFRLQLGICLPDSCDSTSLDRHQEELKLLTKLALDSSERFAQYQLTDLYCLPDEGSALRQWSSSALAFLCLIGLWVLLVLLASLAEVCEFVDLQPASSAGGAGRRGALPMLVAWLSLRANYRKLMHVSGEEHQLPPQRPSTSTGATSSRSSSRDAQQTSGESCNSGQAQPRPHLLQVNLRFLNAFKVMIMFWIVNGHIMLLMIQTAKNILDSDALLNGLMHFLIGATFGVDLFFTMTGFLTSYLLFNSGHARKMKPTTWLYLTFHRYWRLAPLYLLTFWFSRSVMQLLGSGPLWDYGTSALTYRGLCNQESWWFPLTLTSNLHGLFEECMITSWYISCDMQFWMVSPIYLHLLAHHPLGGWLASLATIAASSQVRYHSLLAEKGARYDELVQPRADIFMRVSHDLPALYTHPHYRISAYIVGLLAGHYVYMIKSGAWSSSLVPQVVVSSGQQEVPEASQVAVTAAAAKKRGLSAEEGASRRRTLLAYTGLSLFLLMAFVSYLLANYFPQAWLKYARQISAYGYAVDHLLMSLGASLLIVTMCLGQWPRLVRWLSHPNWTRLSKINYALLLLQCEAIYFQIFRFEQVPVAGTRELTNILFNLLVTLYPLAFAVTLFFEFPLANVEKLLLGGSGRKEKPK